MLLFSHAPGHAARRHDEQQHVRLLDGDGDAISPVAAALDARHVDPGLETLFLQPGWIAREKTTSSAEANESAQTGLDHNTSEQEHRTCTNVAGCKEARQHLRDTAALKVNHNKRSPSSKKAKAESLWLYEMKSLVPAFMRRSLPPSPPVLRLTIMLTWGE